MEHTVNENRKGRGGYRSWNSRSKNREHNPDKKNEEQKQRRTPSQRIENSSSSKSTPLNVPVCPKCQRQIFDISSALADKHTGEPVHFDCVLQFLQNTETLKQHEKIIYIGQGRFAVVYFENPHDLRKFVIVRIIEWEERDKKYPWRTEIAALYSQV
jgi:hypothetical protein